MIFLIIVYCLFLLLCRYRYSCTRCCCCFVVHCYCGRLNTVLHHLCYGAVFT